MIEKKSLEVLGKLLASTRSKIFQPGRGLSGLGVAVCCPTGSYSCWQEKPGALSVGLAQVRDTAGLCPGSVPSWGACGGREHSGCSSRSLLAFKACE